MTIRKVSRSIVSLVENASGSPVVVNEDASLSREIDPKAHAGKRHKSGLTYG